MSGGDKHLSTRLIHNRKERMGKATVNPPVERGSTVLFDTVDALYGPLPTYGRMGLTVHRELEAGLGMLENAKYVRLASNGLQACALAIGSVVKAGDHVLLTDSAYGPTARFCERRLELMGVEATRFDPRIGGDIADLIKDNTAAILMESPGSLTFEVMDTPAIVAAAKARGVTTIMDNTWGAGVFHTPLDLGVDISLQALTKYVVGHADTLGGAVMTNDKGLAAKIEACSNDWGISLSPDDAFQCLKGLRTLPTRLAAHEKGGLEIARWLEARDEVAAVLHPALPSHPDHAIWQRDFRGACGLFGVVLNADKAAGERFCEALKLFAMGYSWGGYESLCIPCDRQIERMEGDWSHTRAGALLRLHVGLEDVADLKADLELGFAAL